MSEGRVVRGYVVPGMPQPLLAPEANAGWGALRRAYERVRDEIQGLVARGEADLLLLYSTQWLSVIGHQIQADPTPEWVHVDPEWHELGEIPYRFRVDAEFAKAYEGTARARGLHARTVAYRGFPIDTGSVVALKLLDPERQIPAGIVSCNMYADRAETLVLGKAARDAVVKTGKRCVAVAITALSNRVFTQAIDPAEDRINSLKDDEWNRKLLEIFAEGRLEDVAQLAREFSRQANGDQKLKAIWWLASLMGQNNDYAGTVYEYQPVYGSGACLVGLVPDADAAANKEYDEEDVEVFSGDRSVLENLEQAPTQGAATQGAATQGAAAPAATAVAAAPVAAAPAVEAQPSETVMAGGAPKPVGAYPHARRVGDLLYLSGVGPRQPGTDAIPGGPVRDGAGAPRDYDAAAQTEAVIANVKAVLEAAGSSLDRVVDVTAFLIDMDRDFKAYNEVYKQHFEGIQATRTTLAVRALPTPIAVEFKVIARP